MLHPSPVRPSWKSGFARSAAESAYPELWRQLSFHFSPQITGLSSTPLDPVSKIKQTWSSAGGIRPAGELLADGEKGVQSIGLSFDSAKSQKYTLATRPNLGTKNTVTVFARCNLVSTGTFTEIFGLRGSSFPAEHGIELRKNTADKVEFVVDTGSFPSAVTANAHVGSMVNIIARYDGANITVAVGDDTGETATTGAIEYGATAGSIGIGTRLSASMKLTALYYWPRVVSDAEIQPILVDSLAPFIPRRRTVFNVPAVAPTGAGFPFQYYYSTGSL